MPTIRSASHPQSGHEAGFSHAGRDERYTGFRSGRSTATALSPCPGRVCSEYLYVTPQSSTARGIPGVCKSSGWATSGAGGLQQSNRPPPGLRIRAGTRAHLILCREANAEGFFAGRREATEGRHREVGPAESSCGRWLSARWLSYNGKTLLNADQPLDWSSDQIVTGLMTAAEPLPHRTTGLANYVLAPVPRASPKTPASRLAIRRGPSCHARVQAEIDVHSRGHAGSSRIRSPSHCISIRWRAIIETPPWS